MRRTLSVAEVARDFAEYLDRAADGGEHFVLMRGTEPVAELRPVLPSRRLEEFPDLLASLPHLSAEEATAFADDLAAARAEHNQVTPHDPW